MSNNINIEEISKQVMKSPEMDELRKAFIGTDNAPISTQINYNTQLKSKVFEKAPFLRWLEAKGRTRDVNSAMVGFRVEKAQGEASFIEELADIPRTDVTSFEDVVKKMSTVVKPMDVGMMAQMGNNTFNFTAMEQEKAFIQIANLTDSTLLQGTGGKTKDKEGNIIPDFTGFIEDIKTNRLDLGGDSLEEQHLDTILEDIVDGYGGNPDCIVTDYKVAKQLKEIVKNQRRFDDRVDIKLGHRVVSYWTINGMEIPILIDGNLKRDKDGNSFIGLIDSSSFDVAYLMRPSLLTNLPSRKLATSAAMAAFVTSQNIGEFCNGLITGVGEKQPGPKPSP